jgi:cyclophilin family peptidyl-prolyl cis-trans isomerase
MRIIERPIPMRLAVLAAFLTALAFLPAQADEPAAAPTTPVQPTAPVAPAPAPTAPRVLIQTSMGDITLELDPVHAPKTVANFLHYVRAHHFDGTVFYRVVPGVLIQAGSYDAKQNYRPTYKPIPLEAGVSNLRGTIAMARGEPDSATAEFFINLSDNTSLDLDPHKAGTGFAVFGHVVDGIDIADKMSTVPRGDNGPFKGAAPVTPITIIKVTLLPAAGP